jgi:hypothetical protein
VDSLVVRLIGKRDVVGNCWLGAVVSELMIGRGNLAEMLGTYSANEFTMWGFGTEIWPRLEEW